MSNPSRAAGTSSEIPPVLGRALPFTIVLPMTPFLGDVVTPAFGDVVAPAVVPVAAPVVVPVVVRQGFEAVVVPVVAPVVVPVVVVPSVAVVPDVVVVLVPVVVVVLVPVVPVVVPPVVVVVLPVVVPVVVPVVIPVVSVVPVVVGQGFEVVVVVPVVVVMSAAAQSSAVCSPSRMKSPCPSWACGMELLSTVIAWKGLLSSPVRWHRVDLSACAKAGPPSAYIKKISPIDAARTTLWRLFTEIHITPTSWMKQSRLCRTLA
jgi:hypothetical protein